MRGSALIYSSHNRGQFLHEQFIVRRALEGHENKRILFLPMSETPQNGSEIERQDYAWGGFRWFFDQYRHEGLEASPFFWNSGLRGQDVAALWEQLANSQVVILGGGHSATGMRRYKELGARFSGEWGKFGRILHDRRRRGLLTVGFSAGADQLCQSLYRRTFADDDNCEGFGLVRNTMVTMHHEPSRVGDLAYAARRFPEHAVFGLPNDSGLFVDEGVLPSGNLYQIYDFVIDQSWNLPSDSPHIRTRHGALIDHIYPDGRHWSFHGGDRLLRIDSPDGRYREAWFSSGGQLIHYWSQAPSRFQNLTDILASH